MLSEPLQVAVFAAEKDDVSTAYRQSIIEGFQGGDTGYLAGAPDTGVPVREFFGEPSEAPEAFLGSALHTLGIVLISHELVEDESMLRWLGHLAEAVDAADQVTPDKHKLLVIDLDSALDGFFQKTGTDTWPQATTAEQLGERAVRPSKASLHALNLALQALCSEATHLKTKFRVFVSHAKLDGQPLANAISRMIKEELRFDGFYDAEDIPLGSNWRRVLQQGVRYSIIIVLRSGAYEDRPWCRQEMLWAEEFASPVIVVDLRSRQIEPGSRLMFDRSPTVRVQDGNLLRIIFVALQEALRTRLHVRLVEDLIAQGLVTGDTEVLVRQPTMLALQAVCLSASKDRPLTILYPDPMMFDAEQLAAEALARAHSPAFRLTTPLSLIAMGVVDGAA